MTNVISTNTGSKRLERLSISFDVEQIRNDITALFSQFEIDPIKSLNITKISDIYSLSKIGHFGVNLTHPEFTPHIQKLIAVSNFDFESSKYRGLLTRGDKELREIQIEPGDFNIIGSFLQDRYLGQVIEQVRQYHAIHYPDLNPISRIFLAYLNPGAGYYFHRDPQILKYHLPVYTNEWSYLMTQSNINNKFTEPATITHLPADGGIWRLSTLDYHTAMNLSPFRNDYRMHILFNVYPQR